MNKTEFCTLANESLIFAQCKAEGQGIPRAQVDLWTASWRGKSVRDAGTGLLLPLHTSPLTNCQDLNTVEKLTEPLPFFLRKQA